MQLNDIYIHALKELKVFNDEDIEKAIALAKNDIVETVEEFIDFINFNIEEKKFPNITHPFDINIIKKAVEKAKKNQSQIVHYVSIESGGYPHKILQSQIGALSSLAYKGSLKNIERKTIMITGSTSVTNNASFASIYFGRLLASKGYNILSSFSDGCELNSILGCVEVAGNSTFFLPHSLEHLSAKEKKVIIRELEAGRTALISVCKSRIANEKTIEESYRYLSAITDCLIVPQLSYHDSVLQLVRNCLAANKPVFIIKYKTDDGAEYDCKHFLVTLGAKYITSNTALEQIKEAIGEAGEPIY